MQVLQEFGLDPNLSGMITQKSCQLGHVVNSVQSFDTLDGQRIWQG
jgi:hypothetical protein